MKALTVKQPWAWAIFNGKDVENRTTMWKYRGPLAIHAGAGWSDRGASSPLIVNASAKVGGPETYHSFGDPFVVEQDRCFEFGVILGTVDLVDVHVATPRCCESLWAEDQYVQADGVVRRQITHLLLENPKQLDVPIRATGKLGLWEFDDTLFGVGQ